MSKSEVKKYIKSLDREGVEQLLLDLYSARKEAKEYLEYAIHPNDKAKYDEYREIIKKEFFPKRGEGKMRFSVCKKAIKDFKSLDPNPILLCDLMLYVAECASEIADCYGDLWDSFYDSAYNNFSAALKEIVKHGLQKHFQNRIDKILDNCKSSGYGFPDAMSQAYEEICKTD